MTTSDRRLLPLWDYGWCEHTPLELSRYDSCGQMLGFYRQSQAFGASFVGPQPDLTPELHGPFHSHLVTESDFVELSPDELHSAIEAVRMPHGFSSPADSGQWEPVLSLVADISRRSDWCCMLRFTEADSDRFHDWGFVLSVFREFVFGRAGSNIADRLVFGFD